MLTTKVYITQKNTMLESIKRVYTKVWLNFTERTIIARLIDSYLQFYLLKRLLHLYKSLNESEKLKRLELKILADKEKEKEKYALVTFRLLSFFLLY